MRVIVETSPGKAALEIEPRGEDMLVVRPVNGKLEVATLLELIGANQGNRARDLKVSQLRPRRRARPAKTGDTMLISAAAKALGLKPSSIYRYVKLGKLVVEDGKVTRGSLNRLRRERARKSS